LHLALPALEALHKAWTVRATKPRYSRFAAALTAGTDKIAEYYEKTEDSDAFIMAMGTDLNLTNIEACLTLY
jgi:hypothetical protein